MVAVQLRVMVENRVATAALEAAMAGLGDKAVARDDREARPGAQSDPSATTMRITPTSATSGASISSCRLVAATIPSS